ncbi:exonuclease V isoform X1 [Lepus europaeus]|uniref:exonuclease V isoform X1 n=2 Tax=Lepus europaeus TaxID=9983 RepID=UPI002B4A16AB|nr:exonuclease V isoform X1 [Lepus europaeus]
MRAAGGVQQQFRGGSRAGCSPGCGGAAEGLPFPVQSCAMSETGGEETGSAEASGFSDLSDSELMEFLELEDAQESSASPGKPGPSSELPGKDGKPRSLQNCERGLDISSPMQRFHLQYLYVTDLSTQNWCELQMAYGKELPDLVTPEKAAVLDTGASIHLARELELHDLVTVPVTSKEDAWAIKFLNILSMIPTLQSEGRIREFPVFGEVEGVLLVGVIDELHYTAKGELELAELKTRRRPLLPLEAQKKKDCFQVSLYKYIFDAMVQGKVTPASLIHHTKLCPDKALGPSVLSHARRGGFTVKSLGDLMELVFLSLTLSDLPVIDILKIEYIHQESATLLGTEIVAFEEKEVKGKVQHYMAYWKGLREPRGVDIEEAWKCRTCSYTDICKWRKGGGVLSSTLEPQPKKSNK